MPVIMWIMTLTGLNNAIHFATFSGVGYLSIYLYYHKPLLCEDFMRQRICLCDSLR